MSGSESVGGSAYGGYSTTATRGGMDGFDEFVKTTDAQKLASQGINLNSILTQNIYGRDQASAAAGPDSADQTKVLAAFNAWKSQRDATKNEHDQYVKALQAGNGRQSTLIAAPGALPDPTTLISGPNPSRKGGITLIGGRNG